MSFGRVVAQTSGRPAEQARVNPLFAASLIVRDEADVLPACLESLVGVVDEIHVHDTGSLDGTPEIAARFGAVVTHGAWRSDFAAARNEAQQGWSARWVIAADADNRLFADPPALRRLLETSTADVLRLEIHNAHDTLPYVHHEARIYRPDVVQWAGRVHERLMARTGRSPTIEGAPADVARLDHLGYATRGIRVAKALRNVELAQSVIDELAAQGDGADRSLAARTLLDLGRSLVGAERRQDAVDAFETLRELFPRTPEWVQATDFLARLVLAAGHDEVCLVLVDELRVAGVAKPYCDWIAAQAYAQLGDVEKAAALLDGVSEVVDTAGRRHDPRLLNELCVLVKRLRRLDHAR